MTAGIGGGDGRLLQVSFDGVEMFPEPWLTKNGRANILNSGDKTGDEKQGGNAGKKEKYYVCKTAVYCQIGKTGNKRI